MTICYTLAYNILRDLSEPKLAGLLMKGIKAVIWGLMVMVCLPTLWIIVFNGGDLTEAEYMDRRLVELRDRLHFAESLNKDRENDIQSLRRQMSILLDNVNVQNSTTLPVKQPRTIPSHVNGSDSKGELVVPVKTQQLLANLTLSSSDLQPPSMFHYLPHLVGKPEGLRPAFKISQGRMGVSIVIGIPHIKRARETYLEQTLTSLIESLNEVEINDCLLVLFVAEPWDMEYVREVASQIQNKYKSSLASGLLEVIAPPASFYPDLDNLKETFGDPAERVKWRTKQNLDFSFLMLYARSRATYYVQLEDDVISKPGYLSTMKTFAVNQKTDDWVLLEFSHLGFIGKLFKTTELPMVVEFFLMFFKDKPIDWLLDHLLSVKICNPEKDSKHCSRSMAEIRRRFKPSLFQHIGVHSSLAGKVQKLKDKDFGKGGMVKSHINPNAEVSTTMKVYQRYSIDRAYLGETFFWGTFPKAGDFIQFKFVPPIVINSYLFHSGNPEHPGDRFYNTTVEVLPYEHIKKQGGLLDNTLHEHKYPVTPDNYLVIDKFDDTTGSAKQTLADVKLGEIDTMRLRVQSDSQSWIVLSEILVKPMS